MSLQKLCYSFYVTGRFVLRRSGLIRLVKALWPSFANIAARFVYRVTIRGARQPIVIQGHQMILAPSGSYASPDMVAGFYEPETTRLFSSLLKRGDSVIDIGAHVGYYTLLAARLVGPHGKVFAFEAERENYGLLVENVRRNGYQNVVPVQKAVTNRIGACPLFLSSVDNGLHSLFRLGLPDQGSVMVETTTLDAFLEACRWPPIDVIKIDVEGSETVVLEGMDQFLRRNGEVKLLIEFCPWIVETLQRGPTEFIDLLHSLGFKVEVIMPRGVVPLGQVNLTQLIDRLLLERSYVNLFCTKQKSHED